MYIRRRASRIYPSVNYISNLQNVANFSFDIKIKYLDFVSVESWATLGKFVRPVTTFHDILANNWEEHFLFLYTLREINGHRNYKFIMR